METLKALHYFAVTYRPLIALAFGVITWLVLRYHGQTCQTALVAGAVMVLLLMVV